MTIYYFGGIDPRSNTSFTLIVTAIKHEDAKQSVATWLKTRGRRDLMELIEKSEERTMRIVNPESPCVIYNDVEWSGLPGE